ncbi:unnamed protein product [Somion occarium]|uniref:THH1/TOM1/TOM3 domain-containing protein n=1 Tax=Somion occarium TaxID=3059160 RepID=A0ABP1E171_9APHY
MAILLDKAYLTAIWLETVFYGMNFVLFWVCIFVLTYKRRTPKINKFLVSVAVAMRRDWEGGPAAFFSDVSIPANVVKVGIHTVNSIIGDGVVVWRCWLVWGRDWKMCVVPIFLVMASAACGFAQTVYFAKEKALRSAFAHILQIWNGSLFSLSLATNVTVTLLISLRVWYMLRDAGGKMHFRYWRVLLIVIESGMIYSVALICELTLYFLNSNAFYIVYDPIAQLTAIVPTMILVLAGLELTSNDVHSRLTKVSQPVFRAGGPTSSSDTSKYTSNVQLESMQFATRSILSNRELRTTDLTESTFGDDPHIGKRV